MFHSSIMLRCTLVKVSVAIYFISLFLEGWGVITSVWLALVLTVVVVTLLSVGCLIFKSKHSEYHFYKSINSPLTLGCFQFGIHNDNIIDKMNITLD